MMESFSARGFGVIYGIFRWEEWGPLKKLQKQLPFFYPIKHHILPVKFLVEWWLVYLIFLTNKEINIIEWYE